MVSTALLLTDPSPHLRLLVHKNLLHTPVQNSEIIELEKLCTEDPLINEIISPENIIHTQGPLSPYTKGGGNKTAGTRETGGFSSVWKAAHILKGLVYLGYPHDHPVVQKGAAFILDRQNPSGSWSPGKHKTSDDAGAELQLMFSAVILQGLALAGYGETPRALKGYSWLAGFRLTDGAWPAGMVEGNYRGIAGYRRLPHSRFGCRSTTTAVTAALAYHPQLRHKEEAHKALDHLLAVELKESSSTGFELARVLGFEEIRGMLTYYVRYDTAFILDLCIRTGIGTDDKRVADIIEFLLTLRGPWGLWEYGPHPQASRWITYDILRLLSGIDEETKWFSLKPEGKFRKYPGKNKRF